MIKKHNLFGGVFCKSLHALFQEWLLCVEYLFAMQVSIKQLGLYCMPYSYEDVYILVNYMHRVLVSNWHIKIFFGVCLFLNICSVTRDVLGCTSFPFDGNYDNYFVQNVIANDSLEPHPSLNLWTGIPFS